MQAVKKRSQHTSMLEEEKTPTPIDWRETCVDASVVPETERRVM
jgi:hypothetical protein